MLQAILPRWSIDNSWHWLRDVPLREDANRDREDDGVQIGTRHQRFAQAAGLETSGGGTLRVTSNRPRALSQITRSPDHQILSAAEDDRVISQRSRSAA